MVETGRLTAPATPLVRPVTLVRVAIIATILLTWEAVAASGLLFRDVVPSLVTVGRALVSILRSEEHTSELQSPRCISYAVFCLKKKK